MSNSETVRQTLLIGCGKMGGALLNQWVRHTHSRFTVCDPAELTLPDGVNHVKDMSILEVQAFDTLIVAIKPQLIDAILPTYRSYLSENGAVFSIAAGASVARLQAAIQAPMIRIMPNLPSLIGAGVAGLYASENVADSDKSYADTLMSLAGSTVWVNSEDGLDRITAVSGSGPGYVFEFARTYVEAAKSLGFSTEQARDLVLGTIAGTIDMAMQSADDLETLRNAVTSKNGTTEAGLTALNLDDTQTLSKLLHDTVHSAYQRAVELR